MPKDFIENPQIGDIDSPALRNFLEIWQDLPEGQSLQERENLSLTRFAGHLPYMALNDYDPGTGRFLVKLFGSGYVDGIGADLTGNYVDEVANTQDLLKRYMWLVDNKLPYLSQNNQLVWSAKNYQTYMVLACPLFDCQGDVTSLIFRIEFGEPYTIENPPS